MILPNFPATLLITTICPLWRSIICGRTALVKEMKPTKFKSKSALSTSNDVFSTKDSCDLPALFTKMSTYYIKNTCLTCYGNGKFTCTGMFRHFFAKWNVISWGCKSYSPFRWVSDHLHSPGTFGTRLGEQVSAYVQPSV